MGKMIKSINNKLLDIYLIRVMLWVTLLFSATGYKYILGIENISTIINGLALIALMIFSGSAIIEQKQSRFCWYWIIFPPVIVIFGLFLNLMVYGLWNGEGAQSIATAIPAIAIIAVVGMLKKVIVKSSELWRDYYRFMLVINIFSLTEYFMVFQGYSFPRSIVTPYGEFLAGYFTLFYSVGVDEIHYRYYACFLEPGTLAIYLIPAIVYSIYNKKNLAIAIFIFALYMTDSLGGYISFCLTLILITLFARFGKYKIFLNIILSAAIFVLISTQFAEQFKVQYEERGNSRATRELAISNSLTRLPSFIAQNPLGFEPVSTTNELTKKPDFLGLTFTPLIYAQAGGFISFIGYVYLVLVSIILSFFALFQKNMLMLEKIVAISLLGVFPFIFQRSTFYESSLYAFLFLPTLMNTKKFSPKSNAMAYFKAG